MSSIRTSLQRPGSEVCFQPPPPPQVSQAEAQILRDRCEVSNDTVAMPLSQGRPAAGMAPTTVQVSAIDIQALRTFPYQQFLLKPGKPVDLPGSPTELIARGQAENTPESDQAAEAQTTQISLEIGTLMKQFKEWGGLRQVVPVRGGNPVELPEQALSVKFQGIDASGKTSAIATIFRGMSGFSARTASFKMRTPEQLLQHPDQRWHEVSPGPGAVTAEDRTAIDDLAYLIMKSDMSETSLRDINDRVQHMNNFESNRAHGVPVDHTGHVPQVPGNEAAQPLTRYVKFFLNVSRPVQASRMLDRAIRPWKNPKINPDGLDAVTMKRFPKMIAAYEAGVEATSTPWAPWYLIPADNKPQARLLMAKIVRDHLVQLMQDRNPEWCPSRTTGITADFQDAVRAGLAILEPPRTVEAPA